MTGKQKNAHGYVKFLGEAVEEGKISPAKAGKSLIALERFFKNYVSDVYKLEKDQKLAIKLGGIRKSCTEVQIFFEQIVPVAAPVAVTTSLFLGAKAIGLTEFTKQFFGTLGKQLALRILSKGKRLKEGKRFVRGQTVFVPLTNVDGDRETVTAEDWENFKRLYPYIQGFVQLDKDETMKVGYIEGNEQVETAVVKFSDRAYIEDSHSESIDDRIKEPFDESKAQDMKIIGKFVDYYGLAHKYHFSFQARRSQNEIGKQKILCIVDEGRISEVIDHLKPERSANMSIFGKATRDADGKVDKIKIDWISEDINFNPDQTTID